MLLIFQLRDIDDRKSRRREAVVRHDQIFAVWRRDDIQRKVADGDLTTGWSESPSVRQEDQPSAAAPGKVTMGTDWALVSRAVPDAISPTAMTYARIADGRLAWMVV